MPDKILVDTSAWIEFFRKKESPISLILREYLKLNQTCYTGPIAVELYQGAKTSKEVEVIDQLLQTIHYVDITRSHYHHAGQISHKAARSGKIFSIVDLILLWWLMMNTSGYFLWTPISRKFLSSAPCYWKLRNKIPL